MPLALFDFDGTLTTRDTTWPFAIFLLNNEGRRRTDRTALCLLLVMLKLRLIPNHLFKVCFAHLLLRGQSEQRIAAITERFHETYLDAILNREVFQRLVNHTQKGDDVYVVSSNFDFFLKPLQKKWKLKGVIATQTEVSNGVFIGRLVGHTCHGKEKLVRAITCFGEEGVMEAAAYGDSASDSFLLTSVRHAYWIRARS